MKLPWGLNWFDLIVAAAVISVVVYVIIGR
jgi:hypothetical protein